MSVRDCWNQPLHLKRNLEEKSFGCERAKDLKLKSPPSPLPVWYQTSGWVSLSLGFLICYRGKNNLQPTQKIKGSLTLNGWAWDELYLGKELDSIFSSPDLLITPVQIWNVTDVGWNATRARGLCQGRDGLGGLKGGRHRANSNKKQPLLCPPERGTFFWRRR